MNSQTNNNTPSAANQPTPFNRVDVDPQVYRVQSRLLDLVDSYMENVSPIVAINDLLEKWLTSPPVDLSDPLNKSQLTLVLRLVDFLVELKENHDALSYALQLKAGKEVSRG